MDMELNPLAKAVPPNISNSNGILRPFPKITKSVSSKTINVGFRLFQLNTGFSGINVHLCTDNLLSFRFYIDLPRRIIYFEISFQFHLSELYYHIN
jgi:hypothetical protein